MLGWFDIGTSRVWVLIDYDWSMSTVDLNAFTVWYGSSISININQYCININHISCSLHFRGMRSALQFHAIPKFLNNSTNWNLALEEPRLQDFHFWSGEMSCWAKRRNVTHGSAQGYGYAWYSIKGDQRSTCSRYSLQPRAFEVNSGWMAEIIGHAEFSKKRKIQTQSWMLTFLLVEKTQADMCEWFVAA